MLRCANGLLGSLSGSGAASCPRSAPIAPVCAPVCAPLLSRSLRARVFCSTFGLLHAASAPIKRTPKIKRSFDNIYFSLYLLSPNHSIDSIYKRPPGRLAHIAAADRKRLAYAAIGRNDGKYAAPIQMRCIENILAVCSETGRFIALSLRQGRCLSALQIPNEQPVCPACA